jgi:hypothetical protein
VIILALPIDKGVTRGSGGKRREDERRGGDREGRGEGGTEGERQREGGRESERGAGEARLASRSCKTQKNCRVCQIFAVWAQIADVARPFCLDKFAGPDCCHVREIVFFL